VLAALGFGAMFLFVSFAHRRPWLVAPLGGVVLHALAAFGVLRAPQSMLEWGSAVVASGFVMLVAAVVVSARVGGHSAPSG